MTLIDIHNIRAWAIFISTLVLFSTTTSIIDQFIGVGADTHLFESPYSVRHLFNFLAIAVGVVLSSRARPVRVVIFRSFRSKVDESMGEFLRLACSYLGRTDALLTLNTHYEYCTAVNRSWALRGSRVTNRWKRGIPTLIEKSRLIVVDVSETSPGLEHEVEAIMQQTKTPAIYIAEQSATVKISGIDPIRYPDIGPNMDFVHHFLKLVALKTSVNTSDKRWIRHVERCVRVVEQARQHAGRKST